MNQLGITKADEIIDDNQPKCIHEIRQEGFNIKPTFKGADSILTGIDVLKRYPIQITKRSVNLVREFKNYKWKEDAAGNFRSFDNLVMKGDDVFNFVQREVPPMVEHLLQKAGVSKGEVDYYMFHQPNKFMLNKLADKLGVPREKMPSNIVENFGNASGVSIPTAITFNLGERLTKESFLICLAGFGVGLTWASILMRLEYLTFNEIIDY